MSQIHDLARLSRIWKDEARLIRKALDDKYKRGYGPKPEDTPLDEIEELFTTVQEALDGLSKVNNRILYKIMKQTLL
ncbi:MAG: PCYCGC domain-containing protein [Nitrosopumilus sp.]|nr:PCYCGC domain-containing protein [Nitrosopumilus sp.]